MSISPKRGEHVSKMPIRQKQLKHSSINYFLAALANPSYWFGHAMASCFYLKKSSKMRNNKSHFLIYTSDPWTISFLLFFFHSLLCPQFHWIWEHFVFSLLMAWPANSSWWYHMFWMWCWLHLLHEDELFHFMAVLSLKYEGDSGSAPPYQEPFKIAWTYMISVISTLVKLKFYLSTEIE